MACLPLMPARLADGLEQWNVPHTKLSPKKIGFPAPDHLRTGFGRIIKL
jgi:hypothetical protein